MCELSIRCSLSFGRDAREQADCGAGDATNATRDEGAESMAVAPRATECLQQHFCPTIPARQPFTSVCWRNGTIAISNRRILRVDEPNGLEWNKNWYNMQVIRGAAATIESAAQATMDAHPRRKLRVPDRRRFLHSTHNIQEKKSQWDISSMLDEWGPKAAWDDDDEANTAGSDDDSHIIGGDHDSQTAPTIFGECRRL